MEFVAEPDEAGGLHKVTHQQIDLLLDLGPPLRYWVNTDSPKGYIVEKLLLAADPQAHREVVTGAAVRYVDWLFPGILGMNMMFSCLFGVGYVVVRYRKSGFLKRLHATPLTAFEFLSAQVLSRLSLILFVTAVLYLGIGTIISFHTAGNIALLLLVAVLGALSMVALGLTIAARFSSEELVGGLLNLLTWPMMLLSGIWFSLEGSPRWVQWIAHVFPLTHILDAARAVMLDGAGIAADRAESAVSCAHRARLPRLRGLVVPLAHRLTRLQEPVLAVLQRQYRHRLPRDPGSPGERQPRPRPQLRR